MLTERVAFATLPWQKRLVSIRELVETANKTESWYLARGDARLCIVERGAGESVVLLHGGPGGDHVPMLPLMALAANFRVITYDRRGSLRSPCPLDQVSFEANVEDLAHLITTLDNGPAHVIAYSAGAHLASAMVEQYGELIGRVVLVSPAPLRLGAFAGALEQEQAEARMLWELDRPRAVLTSMGWPEDPSALTPKQRSQWYAVHDAALFLSQPSLWRARSGSTFYSPELSTRVATTMPADHDWVTAISQHASPVSVVVGTDDLVDLGGKLARTYAGSPNVELRLIPDAGHDAWIDQPDAVEEALTAALRA